MASILNYHGENLTVSKILSRTGKTSFANTLEVQTFFTYYGYSSEIVNQRELTLSKIKTEIKAGRPIWQALGKEGKKVGHAVVIEGYQEKGTARYNEISIMDPYYPKIVDCKYEDNSTFAYEGLDSHEALSRIK